VEIGINTIRRVSLAHAKGLTERQILPKAAKGRAAILIAEEDGSLIPTVQCTAQEGAEKPDRRKCRKLAWKEARVSLVRRPESVSPVFAVTLAGAEEAGRQLKALGFSPDNSASARHHPDHAPGSWIAEQMDIQFGVQGSYLIDFYHLCNYLAGAAPRCSKTQKVWLEEQKTRFKSGRNAEVIAALEPYVEPKEQAEHLCAMPIATSPSALDNSTTCPQLKPIYPSVLAKSKAHIAISSKNASNSPAHGGSPITPRPCSTFVSMRANQRWDCYWKSIQT
jgi:hypothetical protein